MKGTRGLVADTWDMLDRPSKGSQHQARALAEYETPHGSVLLTWDSDGTRHVLVPIGADEMVHPDHSSQGVQLVRTELVDAGIQRTFVDIRCPRPSLFRVFDQIAATMLDEIARATLPASRVCRAVLSEWRQLLQRAQQSISMSVLRGAFAELQELLRLTQIDIDAVRWWTGPHAAPQDFISSQGAIEVKALGSSTMKTVGIHGIEQLDVEPHGFLVLVVWPTPSDPHGANLAELVQRLEQAGVDSDVVRDKLALLGLHDLEAPDVRNARFGTGPATGYLVDLDFPRLSPSQLAAPLHPAVQQVGYHLVLDQIPKDPLTEDELGAYRRRFLELR